MPVPSQHSYAVSERIHDVVRGRCANSTGLTPSCLHDFSFLLRHCKNCLAFQRWPAESFSSHADVGCAVAPCGRVCVAALVPHCFLCAHRVRRLLAPLSLLAASLSHPQLVDDASTRVR